MRKIEEQNVKLKRKVKTLQKSKRRQQKTTKTLEVVLESLKQKQLITDENSIMMKQLFDGKSGFLLNNEQIDSGKSTEGERYSNEIKEFALTLHFYSPKAYEFLR